MAEWPALEQRYFLQTVKRLPVTFVRGQGTRLYDENDKEYLDFIAGWAVNVLGHCHPVVVEALNTQARTLMHTSNQFYTVPQVKLAQLLIEHSCLDRVFFGNSGAEANEGAVKLARKYGKSHRNGAYEVITALGSFHGRTLAMVAATGQPHYQEPYLPMPSGFVHVPFNDLEALKAATTDRTVAVMLEPVQGEGGVYPAEEAYLQGVRAWCDAQGLLLILDEIQTGMGRTGSLFAYEQYGVEPDIMTLAKGLGGGVPIGAFLAKEHVAVFTPGDHGSTFGGNPLACAVGCAVLNYILSQDLPTHARTVGDYLRARLVDLQRRLPIVKEVRGRGLLQALEFAEEVSQRVVERCLGEGLLLNPVKPTAVRFMPPLIVTTAEIDEALAILERVLVQVQADAGVRVARG